ncbi:hypothetical protein RJT34_04481 [Clitoria ternatea]|uniref:DUF4283 domain-containing protein n=1 Tax=Clitoria ternatea TaxID=43366 RepID=A0AAN9KMR6_CLITE
MVTKDLNLGDPLNNVVRKQIRELSLNPKIIVGLEYKLGCEPWFCNYRETSWQETQPEFHDSTTMIVVETFFSVKEDEVRFIAAWVRIPRFPLELYNEKNVMEDWKKVRHDAQD